MRKKLIPVFAVPFILAGMISCGNNAGDGQAAGGDKEKKAWTAAELAGKYSFAQGKDTILMDLRNQQDSLIGELSYSFDEKDRNNGEFRGVVQDSLVVGEYHFTSEGMNSVREIVFGIVPEGLVEGFGDVEEQDSLMVFKDKSTLRFDHGMILKKQ
ncbi:hypothetical protein [Sphingobacterium lactis]|uniref:NlpE N-terminal domain-containing protein n=1 Tax=Sphingobacterium lactis TaxID=797291 RepID=A0A1H5Y4Y7_9SPHI|nr:hypothetical protein [Sphingobacterium lactis]SEG18875.1 hypothetical protein SAMN05421877_105237 [Sphingobacterium lactis]